MNEMSAQSQASSGQRSSIDTDSSRRESVGSVEQYNSNNENRGAFDVDTMSYVKKPLPEPEIVNKENVDPALIA